MITIELPGRRKFVVEQIIDHFHGGRAVRLQTGTLATPRGICNYATPIPSSMLNTSHRGIETVLNKTLTRNLFASDRVRQKLKVQDYLCKLTAENGTIFTCPFSGRDGIKRNSDDGSFRNGKYGVIPGEPPSCPIAILCANDPLHATAQAFTHYRTIIDQSVRWHLLRPDLKQRLHFY